KWKYKTDGKIRSSPALGSETIFFGSYDGFMYALKPDGGLKFRFRANGTIYSSPMISPDGSVYFGCLEGLFYALSPNGSLKWKYDADGRVSSSPAIGDDGTIYFGDDDGSLYALSPDGALKWKYKVGGWIESSPAIGPDGTIYFGCSDTYLYALNPDGVLKWKYGVEWAISSSPAISRDGNYLIRASWQGNEDYYGANSDVQYLTVEPLIVNPSAEDSSPTISMITIIIATMFLLIILLWRKPLTLALTRIFLSVKKKLFYFYDSS
ncbi:MAG: PQQ-binding-like beta-propeller repeat protein, partial [Thermoproteota archaeon]